MLTVSPIASSLISATNVTVQPGRKLPIVRAQPNSTRNEGSGCARMRQPPARHAHAYTATTTAALILLRENRKSKHRSAYNYKTRQPPANTQRSTSANHGSTHATEPRTFKRAALQECSVSWAQPAQAAAALEPSTKQVQQNCLLSRQPCAWQVLTAQCIQAIEHMRKQPMVTHRKPPAHPQDSTLVNCGELRVIAARTLSEIRCW